MIRVLGHGMVVAAVWLVMMIAWVIVDAARPELNMERIAVATAIGVTMGVMGSFLIVRERSR